MLDHAFGTSGSTGSALSVFEFNERAIRSYGGCGFVIEGRAREAIWREGRWWDEISMSILDGDWEALHGRGRRPTRRAAGRGGEPTTGGSGGPRGRADRAARAERGHGRSSAADDELVWSRGRGRAGGLPDAHEAKGHVVDNARAAVARLEAAFPAGDLSADPTLTQSSAT